MPLEIGRQYRGQVANQQREWQDQPFFVLRESTREAYEAHVRELGEPGPFNAHRYYYEVSTD